MLADIRFKLLAFVPTLAGAAIAFFTKTQFYDTAVHRAKWLEALLDLPVCTQGKTIGGLFNERVRVKTEVFWPDLNLA